MPTPRLLDLLEQRESSHRLDGTFAPMESVDDLLAWLDDARVALVSGRSSLPNAAEAIVGRPIRGSWWGDRDGGLVYRLLEELTETAPGYLDLVLVDSRRTIVHPDLVPLVQSIAAEPGRRQRAAEALRASTRRDLAALETHAGEVDAAEGAPTVPRISRTALEAALLVRSVSNHTDTGRHVSTIEMFGNVPVSPAANYHTALAHLIEACLRSAVVAPETEVVGWLKGVEPEAERLRYAVDSLVCSRLIEDGRTWLTLR